jgi:hypothetical protein
MRGMSHLQVSDGAHGVLRASLIHGVDDLLRVVHAAYVAEA